jgi:drug/metabolite transporter (DMT)-like permease
VSRPNLLLLAAVVLWGMTIVPTKWALEVFPPFTLTFLRLVVAGLVFLPYTWRKAKARLGTVTIPWRRITLLSFTGVGGYFFFNYSGVALTSGVNASMISASLPFFTLLLAALYLKEKIRLTQWLGLFLGTLGVLFITVQPGNQNVSSVWGDLLVLASQFIWAVYVIQMKQPQAEAQLPGDLFTALTLTIGGLMVLPFAAVESSMYAWSAPSVKAVGSLFFLILGPTILAYQFWNQALESTSASRAGIYLNAIPLISVFGSVSLLGEDVTWKTLLGGALVLAGVFWAERKPQMERSIAVSTE